MIASKRDSLCMSILRAKYKIEQDWLHKDPPKSASPIWKAIEGAKNIIAKGACYLIGDGASINVCSTLGSHGYKDSPLNHYMLSLPTHR